MIRIVVLTLLLPLLSAVHAADTSASGTRPNILLIVSEDNGPELGCYGDRYARTPNLDRLASEGVRFHRAFVTQAGCSQSRASVLTGLYPHQHGQIGLATWGFRMYREDTPNLPRSPKAAGYGTGIIGKLHINPEPAFPFDFHEIPGANFNRKNLGDHGADMLRGKRTCYEGGVRVPLLLRWHGHARPQVCEELVSTVDLMPTVLAACGVEPVSGLPGRLLQPLLAGEPVPWRTHLFTEYHTHAAAASYHPQRAVRTERCHLRQIQNRRKATRLGLSRLLFWQRASGQLRCLARDREAGQEEKRRRINQQNEFIDYLNHETPLCLACCHPVVFAGRVAGSGSSVVRA